MLSKTPLFLCENVFVHKQKHTMGPWLASCERGRRRPAASIAQHSGGQLYKYASLHIFHFCRWAETTWGFYLNYIQRGHRSCLCCERVFSVHCTTVNKHAGTINTERNLITSNLITHTFLFMASLLVGFVRGGQALFYQSKWTFRSRPIVRPSI